MTESGRIGAIDGDRLAGLVKEFGAVYQAHVATYAREIGIETVLDERTGAARFTAIPSDVRDLFSKRSAEANRAAREFAQRRGIDWDTATGEQKVALLKAGAAETRQAKEDAPTDFAIWRKQAEQAGYHHQTIIAPPQPQPPTTTPAAEKAEQQENSELAPQRQAPSTTPITLDPLAKDLMRAITGALGTRDPAEQIERLLEGVDRAVFINAGSEEPNSAVAQGLWRVARLALSADPEHVERILTESTREAIRRAGVRLDPRYNQPIQAEKDLATADDHRRLAAYRAARPMIEDEFKRRAVLDAQELREISARALITTGISEKPGQDIEAVVGMFRDRGVRQDRCETRLMFGHGAPVRGKARKTVTTELHVAEEMELFRLAKTAAGDKSAALTLEQVDHAAAMFLARKPGIDPAGEQWQAQRRAMNELATGGRLGVAIGVAGAGKTTLLAPLADAWKAAGRQVYGIALAWRQAGDLRAAGIEGAAVAAFLKRVETGLYRIDRNSVVVVDEVGQVGTKQMLDLLRLQERTGCAMVMIGDPKQCNSIEGGPGLELLRAALGKEAIPEILTTIRQRTEREREIAGLFRAGRAAEALEMKQADGTAELVAGGREATVKRVAQLWHERTTANADDPNFKLTVSAPTNADCREIGATIRDELRRAGKLGADVAVLDATDRTGEVYRLPLAIGDRVRLFDRVFHAAANGRRSVLASNGDVVEVLGVTTSGMLVRNEAGAEGVIAWRKIQTRVGEPVRLAPGYATTVDIAQGSTATEHIHALLSGSQAIHGLKAYVAASRHQSTNWIVIDEASERHQLVGRTMLGHRPDIGEHDVWQNIGENLSRQPIKPSALASLQQQPRQGARLSA